MGDLNFNQLKEQVADKLGLDDDFKKIYDYKKTLRDLFKKPTTVIMKCDRNKLADLFFWKIIYVCAELRQEGEDEIHQKLVVKFINRRGNKARLRQFLRDGQIVLI